MYDNNSTKDGWGKWKYTVIRLLQNIQLLFRVDWVS